jgi:hypothetical protein
MELKQDNRPLTAKFTAISATRIVADNGTKCMNFEAGETLNVHRDLFPAAIRAGLVPEGPLEEQVPEPAERKSSEEETADKVLEAVRQLVARGNPADFTQLGKPRAASVKKLVDCEFTGADVQRAFEQAMFEVEQSGDESTQHPESSSSDTE